MIGEERDPNKASRLDVKHVVSVLEEAFSDYSEIWDIHITGAVYDIRTGKVGWIH